MPDSARFRTQMETALRKAEGAASDVERDAWRQIADGWRQLLANREAERKRKGPDQKP